MNIYPQQPDSAFRALRSLRRRQPRVEQCELCGLRLGSGHPHLLDRATGRISCSCEPCAVLFTHRDSNRKLVRIPRDARRLADFRISDAEWNAMLLPIDMAFFVRSSTAARVVAYYPSPAGATESLLNLEAWNDLARNNPALDRMSEDVEALLVNRTRGRCEYFIAPIDECYRLTGLIRRHWRGLSGGDEVWREIEQFFETLAARAIPEEAKAHA